MTLSELVPTLEVCQQLKAAGFPQDTVFSWAKAKDDWGKEHWHIVSTYLATESDADRRWNDRMVKYSDGVAAPTAGELEEWLSVNNLRRFITAYYEPYEPIERRWSVASDLAKKPEPNLSTYRAETLVAALAALVLEVSG